MKVCHKSVCMALLNNDVCIVAPLQRQYQAEYGLSLRGLQKHFSVDPVDYGNYEHCSILNGVCV